MNPRGAGDGARPQPGASFRREPPTQRMRTSSIAKPIPLNGTASLGRSPQRPSSTVHKIDTNSHTTSSSRAGADIKRPDSPEIGVILASTPRPRRRSSAAVPPSSFPVRSRTSSVVGASLNWKGKLEEDGTPVCVPEEVEPKEPDKDDELRTEKEPDVDGSESDSSIDLHTPLPHLMFRDGLLSPRSKLLPQAPDVFDDGDTADLDRARSVLSVVSTAGSIMTKSGMLLHKDPRDTPRRRLRHRDGHLLRAGMGLTTGLGWSDSEDEDAPSTLTRRLIQTSIARRPSTSLSRPLSEAGKDSVPSSPAQSPTPSSFRMGQNRVLSRSASTSLSNLRCPGITDNGSSSEALPSRDRAQSTTSASSGSATSSLGRSSSHSIHSSLNVPQTGRIIRMPSASGLQEILTRHRTQSSASASTSSIVSTSSAGPSNASASDTTAPPTAWNTLRPTKSAELQEGGRSRKISNNSSASTGSTHSTTSGSSTSTPSVSSTLGMRTLHLPQAARVHSRNNRSASGPRAAPPRRREIPLEHQRARTLSTSQVFVSPYTHNVPRPLSPSYSTPPVLNPARPRAVSSARAVSPASSAPASSPRLLSPPSPKPRPLVAGPRPKPRTGTGMAYRTSSYPSLHATAMQIRATSVVSSDSGNGTAVF